MAFYLSVYPYFNSYLLVVQNKSVTAAGHITQTFTFTSTVTGVIVSFIIKYTHHYKYFVTLGSCIYLMGLGLMIRYRDIGASTGALVGCQIAVGIGGGMLNIPAQLGVQASASHQEVAAATAVFLTILEIGGAVGSAISGAIWTNNIPAKLQEYLPADTQDQATAIFGNITLASQGWPVGSPTRNAIDRAYQETMTKILIVAVCAASPCILLSFFMKNYKLNEVCILLCSSTWHSVLTQPPQIDQHVKGTVVGGTQDVADHRETEPFAGPSTRSSSSDDAASPRTPKVNAFFERFRNKQS